MAKYKLNEKQKAFACEYAVDKNGTQAAIRAGYSKKTAKEQASRLLTNVYIMELVDKKLEKLEKKTEINAEYVLKNIKEIGERCMQRVPVMVKQGRIMVQKKEEDPETGKMVGVWEFEASGALKAQELLGKHLKLFTDKIEHSGTINLTDEKRKKIIDKISKRHNR